MVSGQYGDQMTLKFIQYLGGSGNISLSHRNSVEQVSGHNEHIAFFGIRLFNDVFKGFKTSFDQRFSNMIRIIRELHAKMKVGGAENFERHQLYPLVLLYEFEVN
jgi:hypothetical protein